MPGRSAAMGTRPKPMEEYTEIFDSSCHHFGIWEFWDNFVELSPRIQPRASRNQVILLYLDCSLVLAPAVQGLALVADAALAHARPHIHQVVVAAAGQVAAIGGPLEAAHFLGVTRQREDVVVRHTHVMMVDASRSRGTGKKDIRVMHCGDVTV